MLTKTQLLVLFLNFSVLKVDYIPERCVIEDDVMMKCYSNIDTDFTKGYYSTVLLLECYNWNGYVEIKSENFPALKTVNFIHSSIRCRDVKNDLQLSVIIGDRNCEQVNYIFYVDY